MDTPLLGPTQARLKKGDEVTFNNTNHSLHEDGSVGSLAMRV